MNKFQIVAVSVTLTIVILVSGARCDAPKLLNPLPPTHPQA